VYLVHGYKHLITRRSINMHINFLMLMVTNFLLDLPILDGQTVISIMITCFEITYSILSLIRLKCTLGKEHQIVQCIFLDYTLNHDSLKCKILGESTSTNYGAFALNVGIDCIVEAVVLSVMDYIVTPFNVDQVWFDLLCQNIPKYPIIVGVLVS
jgi:hypothetical protein